MAACVSRALAELDGRSSARALAEAADALSRTQVAELPGTDATRISHRTRDGSLYSYAGASRRRRYPAWQFVDGAPLPHLAAIVAALPAGTHPVTVRSFSTTVDDALILGGAAVSPVRWLASAGRPSRWRRWRARWANRSDGLGVTKVPHRPPADLTSRTPTWTTWPTDRPLWQFANSAGAHPAPFARLRRYGPLPSARFDPHPEPTTEDSGELIAYAASTLLTAVAERFQQP